MACVYEKKKTNLEAIEMYEKALKIRKEALGEKDRSVANIYNNLGVIFYEEKYFEKALDNHQKALEIRKTYGEDDP